MRAGRLRHVVTLERQSATKDSFGEVVDTWTTLGPPTVRAAKQPLNGKEYFAAGGENSEVTTRFRMRYQTAIADLNNSDRLVHGSDIYDIESVINQDGRNIELIIMCKLHG